MTLLAEDSEFLPKVCYFNPQKIINSESVGASVQCSSHSDTFAAHEDQMNSLLAKMKNRMEANLVEKTTSAHLDHQDVDED